MDAASKKNFNALSEGLKKLRALYEQQEIDMMQMKQELAELKRENQEVKQQAMIIAMSSKGNGATAP